MRVFGVFTQSRAGTNSRPASPFRGCAGIRRRRVSSALRAGRLWLSFDPLVPYRYRSNRIAFRITITLLNWWAIAPPIMWRWPVAAPLTIVTL